jgi:hypothetical protein
MKKWFLGAAMVALCSTSVFAQSAKNTLQMGDNQARLVSGGAGAADTGWNVVMGNNDINAGSAVRIHTSQQKDLVFGASFECGVYTRTLAKTKGGNVDTSKAEARVEIRIKVDPGTANERTAYPGEITFCQRYQELSVKLQGILDLACLDTNGDGNLDTCDLNVIDDEYVELVQSTLNANAFFFALDDLGTGTHNIVVEARITSSTDFLNGAAEASALIGKGAVTVEEARLLKAGDITE